MAATTVEAPTDMAPDFKLRFNGEPDELSVNTLLPCLLAFTSIVDELNKDLGEGLRLEVRVRAPRPGSLLVLLSLAALAGLGSSSLLPPDVRNLALGYINVLGSLLNIRKHLKNEPPKGVEDRGDRVEIQNSQGATMLVDRRSSHIYFNNSTINLQLDRTFQTLESDTSVNSFEFQDGQSRTLFSASRTEFGELSVGSLTSGENRRTSTQRTNLTVVKPSFEPKLRWEFQYLDRRIGAYVTDKDFCQAVDETREGFFKGDLLDVDLEIDQVWDARVGAFVDRSYKVVRVHKHVTGPRQPALPIG